MEFLPSIIDQKEARYCRYHREKAIKSSVLLLEGSFMRSIRPVKFCLKTEQLALTICHSPSIRGQRPTPSDALHDKMEIEEDEQQPEGER